VVLMFAAALAIALMCQSLAAETFHDVWNPSAGLFPFTLLIFLCWSLACGEYRLLVPAVLVASFVVQAHLMYLPATVGMLAIGIGGLVLGLIARRRAAGPSRPGLAGNASTPFALRPAPRRSTRPWPCSRRWPRSRRSP